MTFHFKMGKLLDYKETLLGEARENLARAHYEKDRIEEAMWRLEQQRTDLEKRLQEEIVQGTSSGALQILYFQKGCAQTQIRQLAMELKEQQIKVEEARETLNQKNREVKELEKLKENQQTLYHQEEKRQESLRLDEYLANFIAMNQAN